MKTNILNAKKLLALLITAAIIFPSCKKEINDQVPVAIATDNIAEAALQNDDASVAIDWYKLQLQMILQANPAVSPVAVNRMFGYTGISLFEAARFEIRNSISLQKQLNEMPEMPKPEKNKDYAWVVSANAAMANITRDVFPALTVANHASIDSLEKAYNDRFTSMDAAVFARSQAFGDSVAAIIYRWAQTDLFNHVNDPYTPPVGPGLWVPTPPLLLPAAAPYAGNCRPFIKAHAQGITVKPPFEYSDEKGSGFYAMVNHVYKVSQTLTEDQKNIAFFWNDAGVGVAYTPMGHSISIMNQVFKNENATLATVQQVYVKAGIAMWDATIKCWRSKYTYNQLRPITYIQKNINATWAPLIITPNHPEYPAAHAFITSAVMTVLSSEIGANYSFTDHTYDFRGFAPRSFGSFKEAASECGQSRVYGGIHFQQSVNTGKAYGQSIGEDADAIRLTK